MKKADEQQRSSAFLGCLDCHVKKFFHDGACDDNGAEILAANDLVWEQCMGMTPGQFRER